MENKENLKQVLKGVEDVNTGIHNMLIPILKDTIQDGNKTNKRLFIFAMLELLVILIVAITSVILLYKQNAKYQEFLSQFEFGNESIYQDVDAGDGSDSIINDGINVDKR